MRILCKDGMENSLPGMIWNYWQFLWKFFLSLCSENLVIEIKKTEGLVNPSVQNRVQVDVLLLNARIFRVQL